MRSLYGSDSLARWYIFHNPSAEVVSSFIISLMEIGLESASKLNRNLDNPIPSVRRDSCDGRCVVCLSITNKLGLIRQNTGFALSKLSRRPNLHTARLHNRDEFRIVIGSITDNDGADNTRRAYTKRPICTQELDRSGCRGRRCYFRHRIPGPILQASRDQRTGALR